MTETTSETRQANPLFYGAPTLLTSRQHGSYGVRHENDYRFSAAAAAIPLVTGEFTLAQRHYPIVFANDAGAMPLAVTALASGHNLFVAADGTWASGCYVPGYVRRYPFIAMAPEAGGKTMLGFDAASSRLSEDAARDGAEPLFTPDGTPTEAARNAMAFCDTYAQEYERTRAFAAALAEAGLLAERTVTIRRLDGGEQVVNGFRLVDETVFRTLPKDVVTDFHTRGILDLIVLHLASQANWNALAQRFA